MKDINVLTRAELAALVVTTLAAAGIDVVLVGGSCVCVYTNERFGSFDLDFVDMSYARKKEIAAALAEIGFAPRGAVVGFDFLLVHPVEDHVRHGGPRLRPKRLPLLIRPHHQLGWEPGQLFQRPVPVGRHSRALPHGRGRGHQFPGRLCARQ